MTVWSIALLVVAGVGAGLLGSVAGLASLASYPALLAVGLPPVAANVTNTVSMIGGTLGTIAGSRPELRGQGRVLVPLVLISMVAGAVGGALLLLTPPGGFEAIVPWLIAAASVLLVIGPRLRAAVEGRRSARAAAGDETAPGEAGVGDAIALGADPRPADSPGAATAPPRVGPRTGAGVFGVAIYGGYFGAASGVMMLALLSAVWTQSLARTNAAKNVATGSANLVAAVVFAFSGPVDWIAAAALCAGMLVGSRIGPAVVRRVPATPLRIAIGLAGLGLALSLWLQ